MAAKRASKDDAKTNTRGRECNTKGSRRSKMDANRNEKRDGTKYRGNNSNDPSWYAIDNQLVNNAGQVSFYNPAASGISNVHGIPSGQAIPGIMSIDMVPAAGVSKDTFSPINVAAKRLFDRINYKNSRNFTYESSDLMIYCYTVASAYAYYAWMKRIYGIMNTYSTTNWYVPDGLLYAMHVSPSDIRSNLADLRYYINYYGRKLSALAIPSTSPVYLRYIWLNSNVFVDANTVKSALYIYNFTDFYRYVFNLKSKSEPQIVYGGACYLDRPKRSTYGSDMDVMGFNEIRKFGEDLLEPLISDQDIGNMSADILKAVEGNIMSVDPMPDDYAVVPVYSEEVLDQIHNSRAYGYVLRPIVTYNKGDNTATVDSVKSGIVFQTYNVIKANYVSSVRDDGLGDKLLPEGDYRKKLIDTFLPNPTAADVMTMTRLLPDVTHDASQGTFDYNLVGTEIVTHYTITIRTASGTLMNQTFINSTVVDESKLTGTPEQVSMQLATIWGDVGYQMSKFTHGPRIYIGTGAITYDISDTFNYTIIDYEQLRKLHEVAVLSEMSYYL